MSGVMERGCCGGENARQMERGDGAGKERGEKETERRMVCV